MASLGDVLEIDGRRLQITNVVNSGGVLSFQLSDGSTVHLDDVKDAIIIRADDKRLKAGPGVEVTREYIERKMRGEE